MRSPLALLVVAILLTSFAPAHAQTAKRPATTANAAANAAAKARAPKPSVQVHERELHRIHELHRAEYALATREGRLELARRLHAEGRLLREEASAERYVYWHESAHMAILAGDIALAWATIEDIERRYAISAYELKAAALEAAAAKKEPLAEPAKMAQAAFLAFEDAKLFDPESAGRLLAFAQTTAFEAKDTTLFTLAAARSKDFERTRRDIEEGKKAVAEAAKSPDDAAVNLKAGSYLCFARGDWGTGLPMLAKGSDNELRSLARTDLERPTDSAARIVVADSWYAKSKSMTGALKMHVLARSCAWYRDAIPGLTGLTKARVESRLVELESIPQVPLEALSQAGNQPETVASIPAANPMIAEPDPVPTPTVTPKKQASWTVLFRSADPLIWNKKMQRGPDDFSIPVSEAPGDIRYVKLTNVAAKTYVIVETNRTDLTQRGTEGRYRWNGASELRGKSVRHLGIVDMGRGLYGKEFAGQIVVGILPSKGSAVVQGRPGWGFGSSHGGNDGQAYAWGSDSGISQTPFEVAVSSGPLSRDEAKSFLSDDLDRLAEANGIAPMEDEGRWMSIFRASDPKLWGLADRNTEDGYAVDLRKVPRGIRYLKLTDTSKRNFVIVEVAKQNLVSNDADSRYSWHGDGVDQQGAVHLGVIDRSVRSANGAPSIVVGPPTESRSGWGFGHLTDGGQAFLWNGGEIALTTYDIAVKSGELTDAERARLLSK